MFKSVTVTNFLNKSLVISLEHPELSNLFITEIEGIGPEKADINTNDNATGDGSTLSSTRLNEKNIVFTFRYYINGKNSEGVIPTIEDVRQKTYKYFPIKKKLTLSFETDNRYVSISGYVESNEPDLFTEKGAGCEISIICLDPYFYSVEKQVTVFSGVEPNFEFPFENDSLTENVMEFGIIENETARYIAYDGDADIGITITIHAIGEASGIKIYNTETRDKLIIDDTKLLALIGTPIKARDDIIIVTTKGNKSIQFLREGVYTNIFNALDRDSDWFTLSKGDNIFAYTAEVGEANLQFRIDNKIAYEGV